MPDNSFDIVSKIDLAEVTNAIQQADKEILTRFDLKGSHSQITLMEKDHKIILASSDEFKLKAVTEILQAKLVKRNVPLKGLTFGKIEDAAGSTVRQEISLQQGIPIEKCREIVKQIKDSKKKVQASIQGDLVRVTSKDRDTLQDIIAFLRKQDFGIDKPKIAVLGLNPHAGDEGLIGREEEEIIKPAVKDAKQRNMLVVGPFSADAFFARAQYEKFDAVLAMYHDQGLIPFKSLSIGEGVNFTAGLSGVRTSPDHGTAFDIAGKNQADEGSFRAAIFTAVDIFNSRKAYEENRKNPLKKVSAAIVANAVDEKIVEEG